MYDNRHVRLMRENPYVRPLQNAMRMAGGDEQLAAALRTSTEALSRWLSGEVPPPMRTYMVALNLVGRRRLRGRSVG